jgi:hypothetical protein
MMGGAEQSEVKSQIEEVNPFSPTGIAGRPVFTSAIAI